MVNVAKYLDDHAKDMPPLVELSLWAVQAPPEPADEFKDSNNWACLVSFERFLPKGSKRTTITELLIAHRTVLIRILSHRVGTAMEKKFWTKVLGIFFIAVGILHFVKTAFFVMAVPPYIPYPTEMVLISGVFEILGGIGLLIARVRKWAGIGLIALLVAVYPANIYMATNNQCFPSIPPAVLWFRLTLQPLLIYAVWICTMKK